MSILSDWISAYRAGTQLNLTARAAFALGSPLPLVLFLRRAPSSSRFNYFEIAPSLGFAASAAFDAARFRPLYLLIQP